MAKITIANENVTFELPDGARILEYVKANSNMQFGCENAECGTCFCTVLKGIENLKDKNHVEWVFLQKRSAYPNQRLGCQLWIKKGEVVIEY